MTGATQLQSTLQVIGQSSLGNVSSTGFQATGNANVGSLQVVGATQLQGTVNVTGALTGSTGSFSGALNASSTFAVSGATQLQGALNVIGASTLATLTATTGSFSGALNASSTLAVSGATQLQSTLQVIGRSTLATASSTQLTVTGNTNVATFQTSGNASIGGILDVTSSAGFGSHVTLENTSGMLRFRGGSGTNYITSPAVDTLSLMATNTGVNTLAPSSTLHVVGTLQASATTTLSSSLVVDTNTLYADAGGNRVGIATIAPSSTLHVVGTFQATGAATFGSTVAISGALNASSTFTVSGNLIAAGTTTFGGSAYTWPVNNGDASQFLTTDGSGVLSWTSAAAGGGSVSTSSAITANYFPFWSASTGTLAGTSTLYASTTRIGVGTTAPSSTLHVVGTFQVSATSTFSGGTTIIDDLQVGTSIFEANAGQVSWMDMPVTASSSAATAQSYTAQLDGNPMLTVYGLSNGLGSAFNLGVGVGTTTPAYMLHVFTTSSAVAAFERGSDDGTLISLRQGGVEEGTISVSGTTISYNAFTGSHYGILDDLDEVLSKGTVIVLTGNNSYLNENAESEILYGITKSTTANSPAVLGAYLAVQEPTKENNKTNPVLVMAVGNGDVWVADNGHDVAIGDYLITSEVPGHAMKDARTDEVSYVFARASEPINWANVADEVDGVKHKKIAVFFESFARDNTAASALALQNGSDPVDAPIGTDLTVRDLTVNGSFVVKGRVTFNKDTAGQAQILKDAQSVQVTFAQAYATLPIVNVTPVGTIALDVNFKYALTDVTTNGFTIQINNAAYEAVKFNWTAFASAADAQIFVSDGTQRLVNVTVVESAPAPEIAAPEPEPGPIVVVEEPVPATEEADTTGSASAVDSIIPEEPVDAPTEEAVEPEAIESEPVVADDSASEVPPSTTETEVAPTEEPIPTETSGSETSAPADTTGEAVTSDSSAEDSGTAADDTTGASDGSGSTPPAEGGVSGTPEQGSGN